MPTYYGENAVMRLLPARISELHSLNSLGFITDHVRLIETALAKTSGLILVTGPTGSGKTTTLHTCLSLKAREALSIISLEDPVEYEIAGVRQVHIRQSHGVTFASGLRSALRQDPDVIMVGEIRDAETARVTIHTALTGHLVLSTLHTNSALEAIPRLMDMGVDHYLLAATMKLIVAQRLARTLCMECGGSGEVDLGESNESKCTICRGLGYKGRTVIAEACEINADMQKLIAGRSSKEEIEEYAKSHGFYSLDDDGMEKVDWGVTTREEVIRVMYS